MKFLWIKFVTTKNHSLSQQANLLVTGPEEIKHFGIKLEQKMRIRWIVPTSGSWDLSRDMIDKKMSMVQ